MNACVHAQHDMNKHVHEVQGRQSISFIFIFIFLNLVLICAVITYQECYNDLNCIRVNYKIYLLERVHYYLWA